MVEETARFSVAIVSGFYSPQTPLDPLCLLDHVHLVKG